jgi:hypothetical protein
VELELELEVRAELRRRLGAALGARGRTGTLVGEKGGPLGAEGATGAGGGKHPEGVPETVSLCMLRPVACHAPPRRTASGQGGVRGWGWSCGGFAPTHLLHQVPLALLLEASAQHVLALGGDVEAVQRSVHHTRLDVRVQRTAAAQTGHVVGFDQPHLRPTHATLPRSSQPGREVAARRRPLPNQRP